MREYDPACVTRYRWYCEVGTLDPLLMGPRPSWAPLSMGTSQRATSKHTVLKLTRAQLRNVLIVQNTHLIEDVEEKHTYLISNYYNNHFLVLTLVTDVLDSLTCLDQLFFPGFKDWKSLNTGRVLGKTKNTEIVHQMGFRLSMSKECCSSISIKQKLSQSRPN